MEMLTQRRRRSEHMDDPSISREELADALRFIRLVNRRLGGARAALRPIETWVATRDRRQPLRVLDIGTGSADIPLAIVDWARRAGQSIQITAVDNHPTTLSLATEHIGTTPEIALVQCDALKLMEQFEPGAFDIAHAGMFLHHLHDMEVMTVLRIMERLTTIGVIWNDLTRRAIDRVAVRLMTVGLPVHVRHDARVSVEAGFTKREALDIARRVGLHGPRYRRHLFGRFTLTSRSRSGGEMSDDEPPRR